MTAEEERLLSELNAHMAEELLGNEAFVERLLREDRGLVERILGKIKDLLSTLGRLTDPAARREHARLQKAEKLCLAAMENAGLRYVEGKIRDAVGEESSEESGVDNEGKVRYNKKSKVDTDDYTQSQYEDFGWVKADGVLNAGQRKDFYNKFALAKTNQAFYPKSKNGEYMIEVNDLYDTVIEGVNNVIVYAKGSMNSPKITRVLKIDLYDENDTRHDKERRVVYALEGRGIQPEVGGLFRFYTPFDSVNKGIRSHDSTGGDGYHRQFELRRSGSGETAGRIKAIRFDEEGNEVSRTYFEEDDAVRFSKKSISHEAELTEAKQNFNYDERQVKQPIKRSEGQKAQRFATENLRKQYTKTDAHKIINSVLADTLYFGETYGNLVGKNRTEAIEMLWTGLNRAEPGRRGSDSVMRSKYQRAPQKWCPPSFE